MHETYAPSNVPPSYRLISVDRVQAHLVAAGPGETPVRRDEGQRSEASGLNLPLVCTQQYSGARRPDLYSEVVARPTARRDEVAILRERDASGRAGVAVLLSPMEDGERRLTLLSKGRYHRTEPWSTVPGPCPIEKRLKCGGRIDPREQLSRELRWVVRQYVRRATAGAVHGANHAVRRIGRQI